MIRSVVQGCGAYLPERIVTNAELAKTMDTSDEWIQQRTGIRQRHIAADGELTSHLAIKASQRALDQAGVKASDLDLIVLATATPDLTFPATATRVQAALGMTKGAAFDVQAVCAGFIYGSVGRRQHDQERPRLDRAGDRRRDLLAHPRLERPRHLRAVRRRRRRGRAEGRAGRGHVARSRRPGQRAAFRRPPARHPLRRRRAVLDPHHRLPAHGRQGSLQARRGQHGGGGRRGAGARPG